MLHERLVEQHGSTRNYQRRNPYSQHARPWAAAELGIGPNQLPGLHRRSEVVPGAQAALIGATKGHEPASAE